MAPLEQVTSLPSQTSRYPPPRQRVPQGEIMAVGGSVPSGSQTTSSSQSTPRPPAGPHPAADTDLKPTIDSLTKLFGNQIPTVKWIPRAARQQNATLLTKLLSSGDSQASINRGLGGPTLVREKGPVQTTARGIHRNLGNIITRRCRDFHTVCILQAVGGQGGSLGPTTSQRRQRRGGQKKTGGGKGTRWSKQCLPRLGGGQLQGRSPSGVCSDETHAPASPAATYPPPFGPNIRLPQQTAGW